MGCLPSHPEHFVLFYVKHSSQWHLLNAWGCAVLQNKFWRQSDASWIRSYSFISFFTICKYTFNKTHTGTTRNLAGCAFRRTKRSGELFYVEQSKMKISLFNHLTNWPWILYDPDGAQRCDGFRKQVVVFLHNFDFKALPKDLFSFFVLILVWTLS